MTFQIFQTSVKYISAETLFRQKNDLNTFVQSSIISSMCWWLYGNILRLNIFTYRSVSHILKHPSIWTLATYLVIVFLYFLYVYFINRMMPLLKESETPQPLIWIAATVNRVERRRFQGVVTRLFPGITYGPRHAKMWSGICEQQRPRWACASTQSDQGFCCPLTETVDTIECINGGKMPGDFANAWDEFGSVHFANAQRQHSSSCGPHYKLQHENRDLEAFESRKSAARAICSGSLIKAVSVREWFLSSYTISSYWPLVPAICDKSGRIKKKKGQRQMIKST